MSLLPSPLKSIALLTLACLSALPAVVQAQEAEPRNRVVIVENVKFDYAQVLNVEPVFQTLRATRTEEHCEPVSTRTLAPVNVTGEEPVEDKGRIGRLWDSVRSMFKRSDEEELEEVRVEFEARAAAPGKRVLISETGWPDQGSPFQGSVPSREGAMQYFVDCCRWAEEDGIEYFYFAAFDEAWKVGAEGDVGAYWGLWDKDGVPKFG